MKRAVYGHAVGRCIVLVYQSACCLLWPTPTQLALHWSWWNSGCARCTHRIPWRKELLTRRHTLAQKADIWSCGVILYAMLYGCYPFSNKEPDYIRKIVTASYHLPSDITVPIVTLLGCTCRLLAESHDEIFPPPRIAFKGPAGGSSWQMHPRADGIGLSLYCSVHMLSVRTQRPARGALLTGEQSLAGDAGVQGPAGEAAGGGPRAPHVNGRDKGAHLVQPRAADRRAAHERVVHEPSVRHRRGEHACSRSEHEPCALSSMTQTHAHAPACRA